MRKFIAQSPRLLSKLNSLISHSGRSSQIGQLDVTLANSTAALAVYKDKSLVYFKTRVSDAITWYEQFTGLKDVKIAQNRVLEATYMLKEAHERRREARLPLAEVQRKLQDILPELRNTPRNDDRYIQLVNQEHKYLKEETFLLERLHEAEKAERDAFEILSSSLRSSHETERAQAEKTKYWSLIASIIGTAIGVLGSSWNNNHKMKKLQDLVNEKSRPEHFQNLIQTQLEDFAAKYSVKDDLNRIYAILKEERRFLESSVVKTVANESGTKSSISNFEHSQDIDSLEINDINLPREVKLSNLTEEKQSYLVFGGFAAICLLNIALSYMR